MGVYIKGMEMPTSCWLCHFQDCGNCVLNNHKVVDNCIMEDRRDDDCPLIPIPPHGRLIDADALFEKVYKAWGTEYDAGESNWFMDMINEAPTIIPAEEVSGNSGELEN